MSDLWDKYIEILTDPAHTFVEFTFVLFIDVLLLGVVWPFIRRHIHRDIAQSHRSRDAQHGHEPWDAETVAWTDWHQDYLGDSDVSLSLEHKTGASAYVAWDEDWLQPYVDWTKAYQGKNGEGL